MPQSHDTNRTESTQTRQPPIRDPEGDGQTDGPRPGTRSAAKDRIDHLRDLKARAMQLRLDKLNRYAQLAELTPHVLRHTFGHNLAVNGVAIQVIADLMGHESLETTRRYVQPGREDLAAAVERLAGGDD